MRAAMLALLATVFLIGCEDHRVRPTPTPTETIEELRARIRANAIPNFRATPTPQTPETRRAECDAMIARPETVFRGEVRLRLAPDPPSAGQRLRVSGEGLSAGLYDLWIGTIWSEGEETARPVVVGTEGSVSVEVVMPELQRGHCAVVLLRGVSLTDATYLARPFWVP